MSIATVHPIVPPINTISFPINESQSIKKLTLLKRVAKIFYNLYQKISNLFSRKPINDDLNKRLDLLDQKTKSLEISISNQNKTIDFLKQGIHFIRNSYTEEAIYATPTNNKPIKQFA